MYKVYWIHKKEHRDPQTQGYVGYTERDVRERFMEHQRTDYRVGKITRNKTLNEDVFITTLLESDDRQECLDYEFNLRPDWNIGWNGSPGGWKGGVTPGRKIGWTQTEESKEIRRLKSAGNKSKSSPLCLIDNKKEYNTNKEAVDELSKILNTSRNKARKILLRIVDTIEDQRVNNRVKHPWWMKDK